MVDRTRPPWTLYTDQRVHHHGNSTLAYARPDLVPTKGAIWQIQLCNVVPMHGYECSVHGNPKVVGCMSYVYFMYVFGCVYVAGVPW